MLKKPQTVKLGYRVKFKALRLIQAARIIFYKWLSFKQYEGSPTLYQPLQTTGNGTIKFQGEVFIGVFPSPRFFSTYAYIEARNPSASVQIGHGTWINNDFCCIAEHTSITIGKNVLIGTSVEILDSNFHGLLASERMLSKPEWAAPVTIADGVFIGSNVKIMKGVSIGTGAVIANSAVVVSDIASNSVAAGNPARVVKVLDTNE